MAGGFEIDLDVLRDVANELDQVAQQTVGVAYEVQGAGLAAPAVGDVRGAVVFQQAWYDWVQTRFEDLLATRDRTTGAVDRLRATTETTEQTEQGVVERLMRVAR